MNIGSTSEPEGQVSSTKCQVSGGTDREGRLGLLRAKVERMAALASTTEVRLKSD